MFRRLFREPPGWVTIVTDEFAGTITMYGPYKTRALARARGLLAAAPERLAWYTITAARS